MEITQAAQKHLFALLTDQEKGTELRVFVNDPGTSLAKCGLSFCRPDSFLSSDIVLGYDFFSVRMDPSIEPFIKDSLIDLVFDKLGSQLIFKAPNARKHFGASVCDEKQKLDNVLLEKKIRNILDSQINPQLAVHGGNVSLITITEDLIAILKFSGGCNGCAMANYTMKAGIETTLCKFFPELKGVKDITDHHRGNHSYY